MAQHIKDIVATLFQQTDNWRLILLREWPTIVGDLARHMHLEKIEHDTLILHVNDACWMQELYMLSPLLLKTINKRLDQAYIKKLRFKQADTRKKEIAKERPKMHIKVTPLTLSPQEKQALAAIHDPQLQMALKEFLHRCQRESV